MKSKIFDWLKRYLPAEMAAIVGAMAGGKMWATTVKFSGQISEHEN